MRRNTTQRAAIEDVFGKEDRPLGIGEILIRGRKRVESLNQATVYRNLKALVEAGRLKRFIHPSLGPLYERAGKAHHHHFHCRICDRAFELAVCTLQERDMAPAAFKVEDHEVFVTGLCPACAR